MVLLIYVIINYRQGKRFLSTKMDQFIHSSSFGPNPVQDSNLSAKLTAAAKYRFRSSPQIDAASIMARNAVV